ncbi:hypothetical protein JCM8547_002720 [Rhodosporidiobolus lusitaniae]
MSSPPSRFEELPDDLVEDHAPSISSPNQTAKPPVGEEKREDGELSDSDGDDDEFEDAVNWTSDDLKDILERAQKLKQNGNAEFGQGRLQVALETYKEGLAELPVRTSTLSLKGKEKAVDVEEDPEKKEGEKETASEETEQEKKENDEVSELRAILSANVAACLLKLNRWKEAVAACDEALEEKPDYTKALHRRAMANESIGSWGSLSASLVDFNKLSALPSLSPLLVSQIKDAQKRLPKKIEVQQQKEKDEVLGKMKDLGNMVLGKFGLSVDNFKMQEQPGGGYSMQFQR